MEKREHINRLLREGKSNEQIAKITKESIESIRGYAAKFTQSKELKKYFASETEELYIAQLTAAAHQTNR